MATETKTVKPQESAPTRFWNWLTETQVWTSVFRHERPDTDRNRVLVMLSNVFLHLHPVRIRKSGVKLRYTWCMGGLSFFLFLVLTFTGLPPLVIVADDVIPEPYWVPQPPKLDRQSLLADLKRGEVIPGDQLGNPKPSLAVRTK